MSIPRGTTPIFTLTFTDVDLTGAAHVYVTFKQGGRILTKSDADLTVTATNIEVGLTQEETLMFNVGNVQIQANWTLANGSRTASEVVNYALTKQLLAKVVE